MLGAQRIAVYGGDGQRSLQSLALTQGQPVTAERERERGVEGRAAAAAVHPVSLQEGSCSLIRAVFGGSRDCRAASLQATAERAMQDYL